MSTFLRVNGPWAAPPASPRGAATLTAAVDLAAHPLSIGDLLVTLVGSLAAARRAGASRADWVLLADPDDPPLDPPMRDLVEREGFLRVLVRLLPVLQLGPLPGDVLVLSRRREAVELLRARAAAGPVWPTADLEPRRYHYYDVLQDLLRFHAAHGALPQLSFGSLGPWATGLLERLAPWRVPVTVNLRGNPGFHPHRNSCLEAWLEFFDHCATRFPVTFFVVCAAHEVDPRLRGRTNVVIAKDHHTDLAQDLALVAHAAFHLGATSGPATVAQLRDRPYQLFHCDSAPHLALYGGALLATGPDELRFAFAAPLQAIDTEPETPQRILAGFERIWRARDWPAAPRSPPSPEGP